VITRDQAVAHHVNMALRHTTLTREAFADDVVALYHQRTPLDLRGIAFREFARGGDPYTVQRANAQLLFRMLDGVVRLPAEVEEAVVLALPEPYRGACLHDLAARYGLMAAALPTEAPGAQAAQLGDLANDFGEAVQALAATLGDGHMTPADAGNARIAVRELDDLIARASSLRAQHQAITTGGVTPLRAAAPGERY
jgi:hypothetical protein